MRVFVTGATGFIGSAVVKDLIAAGHQVIGVYRSDDKAPALAAAGAEVYRGSIDDPDSLKRAPPARTESSTSPSTTISPSSQRIAKPIGASFKRSALSWPAPADR